MWVLVHSSLLYFLGSHPYSCRPSSNSSGSTCEADCHEARTLGEGGSWRGWQVNCCHSSASSHTKTCSPSIIFCILSPFACVSWLWRAQIEASPLRASVSTCFIQGMIPGSPASLGRRSGGRPYNLASCCAAVPGSYALGNFLTPLVSLPRGLWGLHPRQLSPRWEWPASTLAWGIDGAISNSVPYPVSLLTGFPGCPVRAPLSVSQRLPPFRGNDHSTGVLSPPHSLAVKGFPCIVGQPVSHALEKGWVKRELVKLSWTRVRTEECKRMQVKWFYFILISDIRSRNVLNGS